MPSACAEDGLFNADPAGYLPHRYPFLLLDRVTALEPGVCAVALKSVSAGRILPQILLVEMVAQLAGIATIRQEGEGGFLAAIDRAEFGRAPMAGDQLSVQVRVLKSFGRLFMVEGEVICGADRLLTATLMLGAGQV